MGDGNVRHHLNALSGVFKRAASEGYVPAGYNPVSAMLEKPTGKPHEAHWLEVPDAALLLEAARTYRAPDEGTQFAYPLLDTFLLTEGGKPRFMVLSWMMFPSSGRPSRSDLTSGAG